MLFAIFFTPRKIQERQILHLKICIMGLKSEGKYINICISFVVVKDSNSGIKIFIMKQQNKKHNTKTTLTTAQKCSL